MEINYTEADYEEKKELIITSYQSGPKLYEELEATPIVVYYNKVYKNANGHEIDIVSVEVSEKGFPVIRFMPNSDEGNLYKIFATYEKDVENEAGIISNTRLIDSGYSFEKNEKKEISLLGIGSQKPKSVTCYIFAEIQ